MKKLLSVPAYLWAFVCVLLIPITFMGNESFARKMAKLPFMKVHPVYTGGDSLFSYQQDSMLITINKPVFAALIGTSNKGFAQVKISGNLPKTIKSNIDYNRDGQADFNFNIDTRDGKTQIEPLSEEVKGLQVSSKVKDYWVIRVNLTE